MNNRKVIANLLLLLTAFIWGTTFVAQSVGMEEVGPFTFQSVRTLLGAAFLFLLILFRAQRDRKRGTYRKMTKEERKALLVGGIPTGVALGFASMCQQVGIKYSTVGNAGFLTAMYLVLVPLFGIFIGKKPGVKNWICVMIAAVGVYLISMTEGMRISKGDLLLIACAFLFSIQILLIDHFSLKLDPITFSCVEMFVGGLLCLIPTFIFETVTFSGVKAAAFPIFYAGILSCGVAYTLQIAGQRDAEPTTAVLIMSLESVFSLLAGILILHQIPSSRGFFGCALIFLAVIFSQIDLSDLSQKK